MKRLLVYFLMGVAVATADDFRTFTSVEGKSCQAKMIRFNAVKKQVLVERENGKRFWADLDSFSEADQEYILQQYEERLNTNAAEEFLAVSAKQKKEAIGICYEVTLKNLHCEMLENLYMDCRVYSVNKLTKEVHTFEVDQFVGCIAPNEEKRIRLPGYYDYSDPIGVIFRIHSSTIGRDQSGYEVSVPRELRQKYSWVEDAKDPQFRPRPEHDYTSEWRKARLLHDQGNREEAKKEYELLGKKGDGFSYYMLGEMYAQDGDYAGAVKYYKEGFSAGMYESAARLCDLYTRGGNGINRSDTEALKWLEKGAEKEDAESLLYLAEYYGANADKSKRNGALAAQYADRAIAAGVSRSAPGRTSLAAAYAENGQFDYAIYLQQTVVDAAHTDELKKQRLQTLEKYRRGETY